MSQVTLPAPLHARIAEHASRGYPREVCGLLVGRTDAGGVHLTRAVPCPNVAPLDEQERRFEIDPRVVINVRRSLRATGEQIVGFYHSHPGAAAVPSLTDLTHMRLWPETVWLIVPVFGGECRAPRVWWIDSPEAEAPREIGLRLLPLPERKLVSCPE